MEFTLYSEYSIKIEDSHRILQNKLTTTNNIQNTMKIFNIQSKNPTYRNVNLTSRQRLVKLVLLNRLAKLQKVTQE